MNPQYFNRFTIVAPLLASMVLLACESVGNSANAEAKTFHHNSGIAAAVIVGDEVSIVYEKANTTDAQLQGAAQIICADHGKTADKAIRKTKVAHPESLPGVDGKAFIMCK